MTVLLKLTPLLFSWGVMALAFLRGVPDGTRKRELIQSIAGFMSGVVGGGVLFFFSKGETPFNLVKGVLGLEFLFIFFWSMITLYRATGAIGGSFNFSCIIDSSLFTFCSSFIVGFLCLARIIPQGGGVPLLPLAILSIAGALVAFGAYIIEKILPNALVIARDPLLVMVVAIFLFISSLMPRFDLFSPLTMKVMKFIHDFIHQFFESMLIPDHPFFRADVWSYIGLLFGKGVGFWGGLVIWFLPLFLISLSLRLERLPSVSHIRQGAERRKVLASFIRQRNRRQLVPLVSFLFLAGAVYQSRFHAVEYWDPKPILVSTNDAGEIVIAKKGEIDLSDGKIHKFIYRQGANEARFFIVTTPTKGLTVTLDACAICQPDGYGQGEGTVICYYCKTLIPLDTVGKPGGCNPVPVRFAEEENRVVIDGISILNAWNDTVQSTARIKGGGK